MFWVDKIADDIISSRKYKPYWVDDMKTLSGFAHIGSIRGPIIHDLIFKSLKEKGLVVKYTFVFNDFDPIDSLSDDLKDRFSKYMGVPLRIAPSPESGFESFADFFCSDFKNAFKVLGIQAEFLSSWDMYHEGKFNEVIKIALDKTEKIQDIYQKISGSQKKEQGWLPFQVICENCGKLGTTKVYAWDGKEVSYRCEQNLVSWAQGCGHEGKISPFGGTGKLPWKVDWPAHWQVIGVTIEGAGKDLASKGGAYDIAMDISEQVFEYSKPYRLPYEHFLIGGRKMSTSKGLGLRARDWIEMVPPEIGRFLFVRTNYKEALEFNPFGTMAIPDLFDEYDKAWQAYLDESDETLARIFALSQIKTLPAKSAVFLPRFREVARLVPVGKAKTKKYFTDKKGKELTREESRILEERIKYSAVWLDKYAPSEYKDVVVKVRTQKLRFSINPPTVKIISKSVSLIENAKSAEDLEKEIYNLIKSEGQSPKEVFPQFYRILTKKDHGPKLAWLIWENKKKAIKVFKEVSRK